MSLNLPNKSPIESTDTIEAWDQSGSDPQKVETPLSELERSIEVFERVDTISDLKSFEPTTEGVILVKGYHSPGDGGGGMFWWDDGADAATANGGTLIASTVAGYTDGDANEGLWTRVHSEGYVNVQWFGAVGDGAVDDQPACQSAIDYAAQNATFDQNRPSDSEGPTVHFPAGTYLLDSTNSGQILEVKKSGIKIMGDGRGATFLKAGPNRVGGNNLLWFYRDESIDGDSTDEDLWSNEVHDLTLTGSKSAADNPKALRMTACHGWTIQNVGAIECRFAAKLVRSYGGAVVNFQMIDCQDGFRLEDGTNSVNIVGGRFIRSFQDTNTVGNIYIRKCMGVSIQGANIEQGERGIVLRSRCRGISITGCYFERQFTRDIEIQTSSLNPGDQLYRDDHCAQGIHISGNLFNRPPEGSTKDEAVLIKGYDSGSSTQDFIRGIKFSGNYFSDTDLVNGTIRIVDNNQVKINEITVDQTNRVEGDLLSNRGATDETRVQKHAQALGSYDGDVNGNLAVTRTIDPNSTSQDEIADVLGTLIEDLKTANLLG